MPQNSESDAGSLEKSSTGTESTKPTTNGRSMSLDFISQDGEAELVVVDNTNDDEPNDDEVEDTDSETEDYDSEDESDDSEDTDDDEQPKKEQNRKGFRERQKRKLAIAAAKEEAEEAKREARQLKERLEALERGDKPSAKKEVELPPELQNEPDPDDFETYAAYTRAVARHENAIIKWESKQEAAKEQLSQRQSKLQTKLNNAAEAAMDKYEDFLDLTEGQAEKATREVVEYLEQTEDSLVPEMLYYFGEHPDEYDKIINSTPMAATRALARIEGKLEGTVTPVKRATKSGKLPEPIKPLGSTKGRKQSALTDPDATYQDLRKELAAARKR